MTAPYIALAIMLLLDWRQTLQIARNPDRWYEAWNLVLGKHPTVAAIHAWFAFVSLATALSKGGKGGSAGTPAGGNRGGGSGGAVQQHDQ